MKYSFAFILPEQRCSKFKNLIKTSEKHFDLKYEYKYRKNAMALSCDNNLIIDIRDNKIKFSIEGEKNLNNWIDLIRIYLEKNFTGQRVGIRYYGTDRIRVFDKMNNLRVIN